MEVKGGGQECPPYACAVIILRDARCVISIFDWLGDGRRIVGRSSFRRVSGMVDAVARFGTKFSEQRVVVAYRQNSEH